MSYSGGHAAVISAGEWVTATGNWVNDRTHGQHAWTVTIDSSAANDAADLKPTESTPTAPSFPPVQSLE